MNHPPSGSNGGSPPPDGAPPRPDWAADEYLTSGARFRRWNLVTFLIGLAALGAGALYLTNAGS